MEHARTGPSTGSSPLVARTTLPSCTCRLTLACVHLPHFTLSTAHFTSWHVAPRALQPFLSGSRGALVRRSRRGPFFGALASVVRRYSFRPVTAPSPG